MNSTESALTLHLDPLLPLPLLYGVAGVLLLLALLSVFIFRRGLLTRCLCAAAFIIALLNPSLVSELRESVDDVAIVITDRSPSQSFGDRNTTADEALAALRAQLDNIPGLETRYIEAPADNAATARETRLFENLEQNLSDVPEARRAGVILLTDGQVHDIPADNLTEFGPVHALLTGRKNEIDRQLVILEAPAYGIVGQNVTIRYRVEDSGHSGETHATILIREDGGQTHLDLVPVNEEQILTVPIAHSGQNIISIEAAPLDRELTVVNNKAPLIINGVRDRLRVLLVSGKPHAGGRVWRNLLTSDPAVDLVHFTILREPEKLDATPQNELSLIAFPFRELFEVKLYDFDLIVFDQYSLNRILPTFYFANIAQYVREGGALLEASGPSFAGPNSVYTTALADILPGAPLGPVIEKPFIPKVTALGNRHPVTQNLDRPDAQWGSWLRQVAVRPVGGGTVLMEGIDNNPLLILDHVGEGRVAQLASDQIWLWSRGFQNGGPQAELLRRLAHWLMKEPELEENALNVFTDGATITIARRTLTDDPLNVTITDPQGIVSELLLEPHSDGVMRAQFKAENLGIYAVHDGIQQRFAVIGELNPPELRGVITTDTLLKDITAASAGSIHWLPHDSLPAIRFVENSRTAGGRDWIGLRQSRSYTVTGVENTPLFPAAAYAALLLLLMLTAWWREGRSRS